MKEIRGKVRLLGMGLEEGREGRQADRDKQAGRDSWEGQLVEATERVKQLEARVVE